MEPLKTFTDTLTKFQRKLEFQENIRVHLLKHLIKEKEKKRQMETYFRKKGQEFETQKKKLADANAWIQVAEKKLQASEEERLQTKREMEELREKFRSLVSSIPVQQHPVKSLAQFSFMPEESQEPGPGTSIITSSPNSTFNLVSPLVNSPAPSLNSSNYHAFFESGVVQSTDSEAFNDDMMFNTISSGRSAIANTSNSSAFSVAFNNMFTPTRNMNLTSHSMANQTVVNESVMDKTSVSLDNWRANKSNSFGTHDITKKDSSLPTGSASRSSSRLQHSHQHSRNAPSSQQRRSVVGMDRQQVRDLRRISSQPGYLAQRKSVSNRSTFMKPED